jgi:AraC-like DNA-binding protein
MCADNARRKSGASKISPAEATPVVLVCPVRMRWIASTASGAVTAYMSWPLATARLSVPPERTMTSTRKACAERPRSSTAVGVDVSGADTSLAASAAMYVRTSGMDRWLGMVTTSVIVNSQITVRVPTGAGKGHSMAGGAFRLEPDLGLDQLACAGTVIVPALADVDEDPPANLVDAVRGAHEAGARVVSLCTGAFVLAAAGLFPWVLERLDHPLTVEDMARQANMSARNLGRHFRSVTGTTPLQWLLTRRIRRAQELLEITGDSVDAVAAAVGMGTAATLRRHFNRTIGVPPDAYRRTFRS